MKNLPACDKQIHHDSVNKIVAARVLVTRPDIYNLPPFARLPQIRREKPRLNGARHSPDGLGLVAR